MQEKILQSTEIFNGRIVHLFVHDVQLPNGTTVKRELVNHGGAVAIVALDDENNVLLIRQYRIGSGQVMIEIPAGTLEPDEDPTVCAVRELREETGYHPGRLEKLGGWYVAPGYTTEYIHLFIASDLTYDPMEGDDDEFIEVFKVPLPEAVKMIDRAEIFNSTAVAGLLRATRHFQNGA